MKMIQYIIALALGATCLVLAVMTLATGRKNEALQKQAIQAGTQLQQSALQLQQYSQVLQSEAQKVVETERRSQTVLTELGNAAFSNVAIRALLQNHNYVLQTNAPAPGTAAVPVTTPAPTRVAEAPVVASKPASAPDAAKEPVSVVTPPVSAPPEPAKIEGEKKP